MKEGAMWELYLPSELAYGKTGAGGMGFTTIPGGAALMFRLEVLKVHLKVPGAYKNYGKNEL
jgi:FKBP-type peptidyl-prolyl cis-trans isomerase